MASLGLGGEIQDSTVTSREEDVSPADTTGPERRLNSCGTGLSCSVGGGVFSDQGWNLCLLHWHVDSLPLSH